MTDREQLLNPPGWDAPDRKIMRQYIPFSEYEVKVGDTTIWANAEVERDDNGDIFCVRCEVQCYEDEDGEYIMIPAWTLAYFLTDPSWPMGALIEREICYIAEKLVAEWRNEYEEDK